MDTSRRNFLKTACTLCAALAGAGAIQSLTGCAPMAVVNTSPRDGFLTIPLSRFGDKQQLLVRSLALEFDVLLLREATNYKAILMKCSHEEQPLTFSGTKLTCASHGSTFDLNGKVTNPPAQQSLTQYPTVQNGETIQINYKKPFQS
jgi:nitrite reductase/ring-hydroxylating ferredoxin subunit